VTIASIPRRLDRAVEVSLFLLCLFVYAWSYDVMGGANATAHFDETAAIVEHRTLAINAFLYRGGLGDTCDWSVVTERAADGSTRNVFYAAKAPGLSILGVPVYAAAAAVERMAGEDPLRPDGSIFARNERIVSTVLASVMGALGAVVFRRLALAAGAGAEAALLGALAVALGTTYAPYASALYAHVPTAVALALAGLLACTGAPTLARAAGAGALGGIATMVSYQSALVLPALAVAIFLRARSWRAVAAFCAGGLPSAVLLGAVHTISFGAPWRTPYDFQNPSFSNGAKSYLDALEGIDFARAYGVLFSPYRGLFFYAPVLLPTVLAAALDLREERRRVLAGVALWTLLVFIAVTMVHPVWWGGWTTGPRLLVPGLALLAPFAARALERWPKTTAALASISVCHAIATLLFSILIPEIMDGNPLGVPKDDLANPLLAIVYPYLARGRVLRPNLAIDLGLPPATSFAPFFLIAVVLALVLLWAEKRAEAAR
jgi:hypothetical protein